jgi:hypothetical protein
MLSFSNRSGCLPPLGSASPYFVIVRCDGSVGRRSQARNAPCRQELHRARYRWPRPPAAVGPGDGRRRDVEHDSDRKHPDLAQPEGKRSDHGPEHQAHCAREPGEQHRLAKRPVQWHLEASRAVHTRSPPENPRNPRPQLTALNAMARPRTTQSPLRIIEPPSENARPTPRQMIATAPTTRETGPCMQPAPLAPFDVPTWNRAKVHPDHHVQVAHALYSVPTAYLGQQLEVRVDRTSVRLYRGSELVKLHPRVAPGKRSTDPGDYPVGKADYAFRSVERIGAQARERGGHVGQFAERLLAGPLPWTRMRAAYGLLRLCERYGAERVDALCARALAFEVLDVGRIERMLKNAAKTESQAEARGQVVRLPLGRFARDPAPMPHLAANRSSPPRRPRPRPTTSGAYGAN